MKHFVVTGAGSGLGKEICNKLHHTQQAFNVTGIDYKVSSEFTPWVMHSCDVRDADKLIVTMGRAIKTYGEVDCVINCAGVNKIGYLEDFPNYSYDLVMDTNAKSIYNTSKVFLETLKKTKGTILNIISNASHMPMTGSLAYNASKGAAHIMTLQLARELTRRWGITVFGISPNKLAGTGMSLDIEQQVCETRGWAPEYAKQYQLDALLCGEETDPVVLAEFIRYLLETKEKHKFLTGCIIPYGA